MLQMSNSAGRRVGPHRVFNKEMTAPGLAMSRSLGDGYAHSLGVSAAPTCTAHRLSPSDQFVVSQRCSHEHATANHIMLTPHAASLDCSARHHAIASTCEA